MKLTQGHCFRAVISTFVLLFVLSCSAATRVYDPGFAPRFQGTTNYFPPINVVEPIVEPFGNIYGFEFQADGKIVVVGGFDAVNSVPASNVARLNADGTTDAAFTSKIHLNGAATSAMIDSQGRILITGWFDTVNGTSLPGVARFLPSGDLDTTFAPDFTTVGGLEGARMLPDGRYLLFGAGFFAAKFSTSFVARVAANGKIDPTYKIDALNVNIGSKWTYFNLCAAVQPDGKLLMGGPVFALGDIFSALRFMPDGSVDPSFTPVPITTVTSVSDLALLPDGNFLLAGDTSVTRWSTNGTADTSYRAVAEPFIEAMGVGPNGEVTATSIDSIRWFDPVGGVEQTISTMDPWLVDKNTIRARADGSVYIGGGWDVISYGIWKFIPGTAPGNTFADWITKNSVGLPGPTGPSDSLIDDGISNFLRYAFGQSFASLWRHPVQLNADGSLQIAFNPSAAEATLKLLATDDLANPWNEVASRAAGQPDWIATSGDLVLQSQTAGEVIFSQNAAAPTRFYLLTASP